MNHFLKYFILFALTGIFGPCHGSEISATGTEVEIAAKTDGNEELLRTTQQINLLNESQSERVKAIFRWISGNIAYDVDQILHPNIFQSDEELVSQTLSSRKAICQGYSALFQAMCNQCGITSFIVHGYVKQYGEIQDIPHSWNAALIDGKWQLFDATWGAGYVANQQFVPKYNETHCNIQPFELLETRMPFDPVWQLLEQPLSHHEFITGAKPENAPPKQNFSDSIKAFFLADSAGKLSIESLRVKASGLEHPLIANYYNYLATNLNVIYQNRQIDYKNSVIDLINLAINHFNMTVTKYNDYIAAKNAQFRKPVLSDALIQQKIDEPDTELHQAELLIHSIQPGDQDIDKMLKDMRKNMNELRKAIDEDKLFVDKYLGTPKAQRMLLFRSPVLRSKSRN